MEDSFEIILDKKTYAYKSKDSSFVVKSPVCKTGEVNKEIWYKEDPDDADTGVVYLNKDRVSYESESYNETQKFVFDGTAKKFPAGAWYNVEDSKEAFQYSYRLTSKKLMERVFRYDGSCFMGSYVSNMNKNVDALADADSKLLEFYQRFQASKDVIDDPKKAASQLVADIRKIDCSEISLYDGLLTIRTRKVNSNSGMLRVQYTGKNSLTCDLSFKIRYAMNEQDCYDAIADFRDDEEAKKEFNFDDYWMEVTYDNKDGEFCFDQMVLNLKKDEGISTKKSQEASEGKALAKGVLNLLFQKN